MIDEQYLKNIIDGSKKEQERLKILIDKHEGTINLALHLIEKLKEEEKKEV